MRDFMQPDEPLDDPSVPDSEREGADEAKLELEVTPVEGELVEVEV